MTDKSVILSMSGFFQPLLDNILKCFSSSIIQSLFVCHS